MDQRLRLRIFDKKECRMIHRAALQMLRETGMNVQDEDTRSRLKDRGCRESDDRYLLFTDDVVQTALSTVPSRVVIYDRNGQTAVDTGSTAPRFCPGLNCIDVLDHKTGEIRRCLLEDVVMAARLCDRLPHIHMAANLGNPGDIPFEEQAMAAVSALVENTVKPFPFIAHDETEARQIWNYLAETAGGWEHFSAKPFALDLTGPTSPFSLKQEACRRLRFAAKRNLPVVCYPALFPGITGPMTLAGAVAQSAAETLAGIVVHQLERPGAPVITGSAVIPMDMRTANLAYGAPDYSLVGLAAVDYFEEIGVPTWIGAGCSDAHIFDAQAISESGVNMFAAAMSGTAFVHNLGYLSSGKTGSLEMLVLCDELAGMVSRIGKGIQATDETLAQEVIALHGRNGKYLTHRHTKKHVRTELWIPTLFQRFPRGRWRNEGAKTTTQMIHDKLVDLLN